ncbi:hypothetical protein [Hymenobacter arizonensis]|uniref:hypothetical protein n=1 Tax=Hymenobacter arizonensis TaxID=1227077 RepID=UPI000B8914EA|nr:hypothetical protein [Hymenobacter arizonensis]
MAACTAPDPSSPVRVSDHPSGTSPQASAPRHGEKDQAPQKALLQGIWTLGHDANALFTVAGDHLVYLEHEDDPIQYDLAEGVLYLHYTGGLTTANPLLQLTADSLVFRTEDSTILRLGRMP